MECLICHKEFKTLCRSCHTTTLTSRNAWTYQLSVLVGLKYGNPQGSMQNGCNSMHEPSETRSVKNPTNNPIHECPTS